MKRNIFIGGAWPYANNSLHIGHLAALLPGDVIARYFRKNGDNVIYVSGTDSHGTPITVRARSEKINPQDIASKYHEEFMSNFKDLNFSYDLYTTTTSGYHKEKVGEYFKKLFSNGYILKKEEEQDFCEQCNNYLSDREIIGICPYCGGEARGDQCDSCLRTLNQNEIINRVCKVCGQKTVMKKNKHLYFSLSSFQNSILKLVEKNESVWRKNAINETKKFLDMGLIDRAATRQLDWGVPVPIEGYEDKRIYVWFEAVLGYLTAGQYVAEENGINFEDYIRSKGNLKVYLVHGKDNIPFHTVIYPSLLQAIDKEIHLPDFIISCEYVNMNNEKMSKSKGNLISVNELLSKYNVDTVRYYMLAFGPEKRDVNFKESDLIQAHNKFLVGVLGNFVNRNLSFISKKYDGVIIEGNIDLSIQELTKATYTKVAVAVEQGELRSAMDMIMNYVNVGNKYYDEQKPWIQVKEDMNKFNDISYTCAYMIVNIANLLEPFMPKTSTSIKNMIEYSSDGWKEVRIQGNLQIKSIQLLFERIDEPK